MLNNRIAAVCGKQNKSGRGVFPPPVCVYCYGCPIASLVVGVLAGDLGTAAPETAKPIPAEQEAEVIEWLNKVEAKL